VMTDNRLHDVARLSSRIGFKNYCRIAHVHNPSAKIIVQIDPLPGNSISLASRFGLLRLLPIMGDSYSILE
jgi:hypothetical protein